MFSLAHVLLYVKEDVFMGLPPGSDSDSKLSLRILQIGANNIILLFFCVFGKKACFYLKRPVSVL